MIYWAFQFILKCVFIHPTLQPFSDSSGGFVFANTRGVCAWLMQGCDRLCCTSTLCFFSSWSSSSWCSDWPETQTSFPNTWQLRTLVFFPLFVCFFIIMLSLWRNLLLDTLCVRGTIDLISRLNRWSIFSAMWLVSVSTSVCTSFTKSLELTNLTKCWLCAVCLSWKKHDFEVVLHKGSWILLLC